MSAVTDTPPRTNPEPVLTVNVVTGLVLAIAAVLVAFNVPLTREQTVALVGLVAAGYPVAGWIARKLVAPWWRVVATRKANGTIVAGPAAVVDTGSPVTEPLPRRAREDSGH